MNKKPTRKQAEDAVRTLLQWVGEDVTRTGLIDTPKRVIDSYEEYFSGYNDCPISELSTTFDDLSSYKGIVILKDITLESHCEHHMIPILGTAHIAYIPNEKVVGLSKIVRVLDIFSHRLQSQEKLTSQIANTIFEALNPKAVAVMIEAKHQCMTTRGIHKPNNATITQSWLGEFETSSNLRAEFLSMIKS